MTSVAIVEKIENGKITVSSIRKGACGDNCAMCGSCNAERLLTEVHSDILVDIGDTVRIKSDTRYVLSALISLFILPICAPIVTYIITFEFNSLFSYILTTCIFLITVVFVFFLSKSKRFLNKITPRITDIIKKK